MLQHNRCNSQHAKNLLESKMELELLHVLCVFQWQGKLLHKMADLKGLRCGAMLSFVIAGCIND